MKAEDRVRIQALLDKIRAHSRAELEIVDWLAIFTAAELVILDDMVTRFVEQLSDGPMRMTEIIQTPCGMGIRDISIGTAELRLAVMTAMSSGRLTAELRDDAS